MFKSAQIIRALCFALLLGPALVQAAEESAVAQASPYQYLPLGDDIVTNYQTNGSQLGFLRVSVSLMVANQAAKDKVALHEPQIRDALIWILSAQDENQVKSLNLREATRKAYLEKVNALLQKELGEKPVLDVLFTTYIYQ